RPTYFWRSAAIHGYHTVPNYLASHGCVRVTHHAMDFLWHKEALPHGMPVHIY
ncbi:MAG: L,D-transpeptidase, partial [Actinomycetota bacterium]